MEWVCPVEVFRSGKQRVLVLGTSRNAAAKIAPKQSVDDCVREAHQGLIERFFRRGRIDTSLEILLAMFLEPTVLFYGFDTWTPQRPPIDGDVEDSFHEDLEVNENTGTEVFTNVAIIISAGG